MKKIAIVGSEGYIAKYIIQRLIKQKLNKIIKIDKIQQEDILYLDLENPKTFQYNQLKNIDFIIFTAAISSPDICAKYRDFAWNINVTGTQYFINQCLQFGCKVLFFSSDAVFGDIKGEIYNEDSKTEAITPYGQMKKEIEDIFCKIEGFKAIRLSYVISKNDRFVSYCLECIRNKQVAEVFHPFYRNCITVSDIIDVVEWFIYNWDKYDMQLLNIAGNELVSRVRIADEINRIYTERLKYRIIRPDDSFYLNRPAITQMESLFLRKYDILKEELISKKIQYELEDVII